MPVSEVDRRRAPVALERQRYSRIPEVLPIPDLIELQRKSYDWFVEHGLRDLLDEICPIEDFTGKTMELRFNDYEFGEPQVRPDRVPRARPDLRRPLHVKVELRHQGDRRDQGAARLHGRLPDDDRRRHLHHQRRRARRRQPAGALAGRLLHATEDPHHRPRALQRQAHPEPRRLARVRDRSRDVLSVKVDRKRKIAGHDAAAAPIGYGTNEEILALFADVDDQRGPPLHPGDARPGPTKSKRRRR